MLPTVSLVKYLTPTQRRTVQRLQEGETIRITDRYIRDVCKALVSKGAAIYVPYSHQRQEVVIAPDWQNIDVSIKPRQLSGLYMPEEALFERTEKPDPFKFKIPRPPAIYSNVTREEHIARILNSNRNIQ